MAANTNTTVAEKNNRLVLSDFSGERPYYMENTSWRGFSDRVMGGISDAAFGQDVVAGKTCARMTGNVTRESNGGFIQMAMFFGSDYSRRSGNSLDGSAFDGLELMVYGNNEDYNIHVRTQDCGWYEQSYRYTFFAEPEWQRIRVPWDAFKGNGVDKPLDASTLQRIAILGWMREFEADISLAEISLYTA